MASPHEPAIATPERYAEWAANIQAEWNEIKAIRDARDAAEADRLRRGLYSPRLGVDPSASMDMNAPGWIRARGD